MLPPASLPVIIPHSSNPAEGGKFPRRGKPVAGLEQTRRSVALRQDGGVPPDGAYERL